MNFIDPKLERYTVAAHKDATKIERNFLALIQPAVEEHVVSHGHSSYIKDSRLTV